MSFVVKKPLTTSRRKMITRQQISDIISYGQIITTTAYAKPTQIYLEKLITSAKKDCLLSRRKAESILLTTKTFPKDKLIKRLFDVVSKKYQDRNGGYSRLLKTEKGILIQLV